MMSRKWILGSKIVIFDILQKLESKKKSTNLGREFAQLHQFSIQKWKAHTWWTLYPGCKELWYYVERRWQNVPAYFTCQYLKELS